MPGRFDLPHLVSVGLLVAALVTAEPPPGTKLLRHVSEAKLLNNIEAGRNYPMSAEVQVIGLDGSNGGFVQEAGQGMYAIIPLELGARLGDWFQISGTTMPGSFGPILKIDAGRKLRSGPMPVPHLLTRSDLEDPDLENFWALAHARITRIRTVHSDDNIVANLLIEGIEVALTLLPNGVRPAMNDLLDDEVEIEGIYGSPDRRSRRARGGRNLY